MATPQLDPFNIGLLQLTDQNTKLMVPVTSLDITDGGSMNLHEHGLFSTSIFGRVGDPIRDKQFSYIDLKVGVLHPLVFRHTMKLKSYYQGIVAGSEYAKWDDVNKDFVPSSPLDGNTGYAFFMSHWSQIEFSRTDSNKRDAKITFIEQYKDDAINYKIAVIPAGLRDIEIGKNGQMQQDEINDYYRRILGTNNLLGNSKPNDVDPTLDQSRKTIQYAFNDVYAYLEKIIRGKRGFLQNRLASRRIFNGTGNIITVMNTTNRIMGGGNSVKFTDTVCGLFQCMKGIEPVTIHLLMNGFLSRVFGTVNGEALLTDRKTLKASYVPVRSDTYDRWMSPNGLQKVISSYENKDLRHKPIMIDGKYLGLIFIGELEGKKVFRLFSSIDELPPKLNKANVQPIALIHLLYLSGYRDWNRYPATFTRYPIATLGSIYPTTVYVKTTVDGESRWELDEMWNIMGDHYVAHEFPIGTPGSYTYYDSMSPHSTRLAMSAADFDGDKCYLNFLYTEDAVEEIKATFKKRTAFVNSDGSLRTSADLEVLNLVLHNMTGD